MPAIAWLAITIAAAVAAYLVAWPAWLGYRSRETRDANAERYLQWRGRADRSPRASTREGMTGEERRRIYTGAALAVGSVIALLAFFAST